MQRDDILQAFAAVGAELGRSGITADVYVVGGAAIALAYDERRSTRDVDAVFAPKNAVYRAAAAVADELGLPEGWLNDAVKGFLLGPDPYRTEILEVPGLRCEVASAEVVLVMKCLAHRIGEDEDDVRLLAAEAGLGSAREVLDLVERMAPAHLLSPQVRFFVDAVLEPG